VPGKRGMPFRGNSKDDGASCVGVTFQRVNRLCLDQSGRPKDGHTVDFSELVDRQREVRLLDPAKKVRWHFSGFLIFLNRREMGTSRRATRCEQ
jgi:hypothetical protein